MITQAEYLEMCARVKQKDKTHAEQAATREIEELHHPIIKWCMDQIPAVPYVHHRTDKKSGITEGANDFFLFYKGYTICIECKAADGKLSDKQRIWIYLMEKQGFTVHVIRSMEQFFAIIHVIDKSYDSRQVHSE